MLNKLNKIINKTSKKLLMLGLLGITIFSLPIFVNAYQKTKINVDFRNDFVVGPGRTEVFMNPGETVTKTITVTNRVNKRVDFSLVKEDFKGSGDPNVPVVLLGDEIGPYSLKDFLQPEIDNFSLEPGEQITFNVRISVPDDSEPGGFYGALVISNVKSDIAEDGTTTETEGQTKIVSRIASLFLVRVNGEVEESGYLSDFKLIEPKLFYTKRPDGFEIFYENNGSVHLVPYGTIEIKNIFGKAVDILPVDAYAALPDSNRYRQIFWEEGFSIGYYRASLSLYKGYGDEFDTAEVGFLVLPWKFILITLLSLLILSAIIYFISTRFEFKRKS